MRPEGGAGRPAGGPGYATGYPAPGRARPADPDGPAGKFDGGYAPVIRAADTPIRPGSRTRPANPGQVGGAAHPAVNEPADVYVYRDTGEADTASPGQGTDERDASYWYDLSGADNPSGARGPAETRGPFEPLVSSSDPQRMTPAPDSSAAQAPPNAGGDVGLQDPAPARAGNLEQIREFYLTTEAIGEQNVDQHFDQLLAQQRELISEYFKPSPAAAQAGADHDGAVTPGHPGVPGVAGGEPDTAHQASVVAEQPRVW